MKIHPKTDPGNVRASLGPDFERAGGHTVSDFTFTEFELNRLVRKKRGDRNIPSTRWQSA